MPVVEQAFSGYERANLHLTVEELVAKSDPPAELVGVVLPSQFVGVSLAKLSRPATAKDYEAGPVEYADVQLADDQRLVLEYKFFEPAFYHTDVPDWGTSFAQVSALGDRAVVCLDTGHHAPGTNIEFIVMQLLRLGKLGSFDFNSRFYADDDLIVGAADPFQLFRILVEVVRGGGFKPVAEGGVAFMLDQCHNIEPKIPALIRSVLNVQEMLARALLVDRDALEAVRLQQLPVGVGIGEGEGAWPRRVERHLVTALHQRHSQHRQPQVVLGRPDDGVGEPPPGAEDAPHARHRPVGFLEQHDAEPAQRAVDAPVGQIDVLGVHHPELDSDRL